MEETIPPAESAIGQAGLVDRMRVMAQDYRLGTLPEPVDVASISNYTMDEMAAAVEQAGLCVVPGEHLMRSVVMNGIIECGREGCPAGSGSEQGCSRPVWCPVA